MNCFDFEVRGEIKLGQFLKAASLVPDGASARAVITNEDVMVNGEIETRRGRTLKDGDLISVDLPSGRENARIIVTCES